MLPDLATLEDIAIALNLFIGDRPDVETIEALCRRREIEYIQVTKQNIRISRQALSAYLEKNRYPALIHPPKSEKKSLKLELEISRHDSSKLYKKIQENLASIYYKKTCTGSLIETPAPKKLTVGEALIFYLDNHIPTTVRPTRGLFNHRILIPFWKELHIEQVTKARCQQYCQLRRTQHIKAQEAKRHRIIKEKSNDGLRRELEHLSAALYYAAENGLIERAPKLWKPTKAKSRQKWFTHKDVARILRIARTRRDAHSYMPLFILLGIYSGARPGAILNLLWSQVDLKNDLIDYRSQQISKTKGYSVVPIPAKLKRELLRHKKSLEASGKFTANGHVINDNLRPIGSVKNSFKEICRLAGIEDPVSPNTLRHTHASWLKQKGIPSASIAENMGHTSPQMVDRTYGHMSKSYIPLIKKAW